MATEVLLPMCTLLILRKSENAAKHRHITLGESYPAYEKIKHRSKVRVPYHNRRC
jgi:hypothetical protein